MEQAPSGRALRGPVRMEPDLEESTDSGESGSEHDSYTSMEEDAEVRARQMAFDAYGRADSLHRGCVGEDNPLEDEVGGGVDGTTDFDNLIQECTGPLYAGSRESRMQSGVVLLTLSTVFGVSDAFLSALLTYLSGTLLPAANSLPRTCYELKTMIRRLGLDHDRYDSCPNGHVLFEGDVNGALLECPRCQHPRFLEGSTCIPYAVTRYFPLIPKLIRLYKCPKIANLLNHFKDAPEGLRLMKSVVDSLQWQEVSRLYPEFRNLSSSLRLGLIADGVCPHGSQSSKHSTWIILLAIYNFPPWLCTKKFFLNLSILIPGPKAPTSETIDVYLKPLVRELLELWDGVPALNMSKPVREHAFTLRAMLLWSVHDFPALGLIAGQTVKGYAACPVCGGETFAEHSRCLKKMVYLGNRRFLPDGHRFRRARAAFNNRSEHSRFPQRRTGVEIMRQGMERSQFLRNGGVEDSNDDPVKQHGVKRVSILYALPYWKVRPESVSPNPQSRTRPEP